MAELDRVGVRRPALLRPQRDRPRGHGEQNAAIGAYIRWRNARAEPKANFAPGSPVRTWTQYPTKAA
ncbi:hypothetical protein [Streptomyces sp. NPDC088246]|uniref:hypothetical protein n=1 Tax=Streptomyces sp. NPDC088246 TaxID=3365842 RepID=UPI00381E0526